MIFGMQNHHYLFLTNFRPVGSTFIFSLDETALPNHVGDVTIAIGTLRNDFFSCEYKQKIIIHNLVVSCRVEMAD